MTTLEQTYRAALRWYPKAWRREKEDAVLGILLDVADEEQRTAPEKGELANLRVNGVAVRFGFIGRALPATVRMRAGAWMLGLGFAVSLVGLFFGGWTWASIGGTYLQVWSLTEFAKNILGGQGEYLVWLAAGVAAFIGLRRVALWLVAASIPVSVLWPTTAWALGLHGHPTAVTLLFLDLAAVVAISGLATPQRHIRVRAATWSVVGVALIFGTYWLRTASGGYFGNGALSFDPFLAPFAVWAALLGIPAALIAAVILRIRGRHNLAASILWSAVPAVPLLVLAWGWHDEIPALAGIITIAVVVAALAAVLLKAFGLRITRA